MPSVKSFSVMIVGMLRALNPSSNAAHMRFEHSGDSAKGTVHYRASPPPLNVRSFSEGIRGRSAHIRRWLGVGAPRRTCKKLSRGLVSVTLKSSGTILNVAHCVRTLHVFQRSSLGLPEAGGRGRGTDLPIGRMPTLRPGAA